MTSDVGAHGSARGRRPLHVLLGAVGVAALALVAGLVALQGRGDAQAGPYATLPLPAGVTDLALSADGTRAIAASVTYNRERSVPERVVTAIDPPSGRVLWQRALAAASCCAFPVFSTTPDAEWLAVGGTKEVEVFRFHGAQAARVPLGSGSALNNVVRMGRDGRRLVAGQANGEVVEFVVGRERASWRVHVGAALLDLAVGGAGQLAVLTPDGVVALSGTPPTPVRRMLIGPVAVGAVVPLPRGFAVVWRGADERVRVGILEEGRWRWKRLLGRAGVPELQADRSGRWMAISDFLGGAWWLVSGDGRIQGQAPLSSGTAAVSSDGRAALARRDGVDVRVLPSGRLLWQGRLPGRAHRARLSGSVLAVLGSEDPEAVLPDRLWLFRLP